MSAYAAGLPLGDGLRALVRAIEIIRGQASIDRPMLRHVRSDPASGGSGVAAQPAPRPYPSPRRPRPTPYPLPQRDEDDVVRPLPRIVDSPVRKPSPHPRPPAPAGPSEPVEPPPAAAEQPESEQPDLRTWELVERAQAGEAEAFGQLYDKYVDLVHRYIYYRVNDRSTAEDFTSETFLRAWRRIGSVTNQGRDIGAWFVTIARNIVLDHVKSSRYRLEVTTAEMLDADRAEDGPEGAVLDHLTNVELIKCVQRLNSEQQECIVLRFLEGLSVAETAEVMHKNEGAIKALQHRAVRRLATLLPEGLR